MTIHAVYGNGVIRPTEKVNFPDPCEVEIEVRQLNQEPSKPVLHPMREGVAKIYAILGVRHDAGLTDTAERHNEHQPGRAHSSPRLA